MKAVEMPDGRIAIRRRLWPRFWEFEYLRPDMEAFYWSQFQQCNRCGGPHQFDTSLDSEQWNRVIRARGLGDYLCANCILRAFALSGESFTAKLYSDEFNGLEIAVTITQPGHPTP